MDKDFFVKRAGFTCRYIFQCLLNIENQIFNIFKSYTQSDKAVCYSCRPSLFVWNRFMRHCC